MGKAVKDNRPARAVLSAPYPLPIVITRSQLSTAQEYAERLPPISTTNASSLPLETAIDAPRTGGAHPTQRTTRNRVLRAHQQFKSSEAESPLLLDVTSGNLAGKPARLGGTLDNIQRKGIIQSTPEANHGVLQAADGIYLHDLQVEEAATTLAGPAPVEESLHSDEGDEVMEGDDESEAVGYISLHCGRADQT